MPKPRRVDAKIARLRALREQAPAPEHLAQLGHALGDRLHLVVAQAAEIAGSRNLPALAPDLVGAFDAS
jgi:sensor domain CHASE-containing protein